MHGNVMARHLVLVGGGHAHLQVLATLDEFTARGHGATLISPSPYHFYSGMGPGLLSRTYRPQQARFHIAKMVRGRALYRLRSQTIEPIFGQIKTVRGCDRFMRRGHEAARSEWRLICGAHNLLKLFRSGKAEWN